MTLDWNEYIETAVQAAGEGIVLLKNDRNVLPLPAGCRVAVYGRIQTHYYKSGTGSGGLVNVSGVIGILDALLSCPDVSVNRELLARYREWEETHPFDEGIGWGNEPWSQEEMPLDYAAAAAAAAESDVALVIIGRSAGEDKDNKDVPGAYRLSATEKDMLKTVRAAHAKMVVLLNTGGIMDTQGLCDSAPDALAYVWQGGMIGGRGVCDVLTGRVSPSGKLTDTIAKTIADYPSSPYFGDAVRNFYAEDIYVGYRYFETAAPEAVLYPFGFGLSYTTFDVAVRSFSAENGTVRTAVAVTNTGGRRGKEAVQLYAQCPQGKLGKPKRVLVAFGKTRELGSGESQTLTFELAESLFASYDDGGVTGYPSCYMLESGTYTVYAGTSVRDVQEAGSFTVENTRVTETLKQLLAPERPFRRMKPRADENGMDWEDVPLSRESEPVRRAAAIPSEILYTGDAGITLADVRRGGSSMEAFVAQFSDDDLSCVIRGEGMGSPKVTPGTAGAFGGVSAALKKFGVPCACCADGPSGMRLDSGAKAFSLPCGTLLACTFNTELVERLFFFTGLEMAKNRVDVLLGPGMNVHRHPLNGRNFEYFSEDPLVTGKMAAAQIRGLHSAGSTGTLKHFCCNNQEFKRAEADVAVSERALREIYLKGYEIAVKEGGADAIMTMYGSLNGVWAASRFDLNTAILRGEWGFDGVVMTDWWAVMNDYGASPSKTNFAAMARAQNDLYMVCLDAAVNSTGDNTLEALASGTLARSELQRSAANICRFLMKTRAFGRLSGTEDAVTVVNRPAEDRSFLPDEVVYHTLSDSLELDLSAVDTSKDADFVIALNTERLGGYDMELTGASDLGELSQIPVTVFSQGIAAGTFTWNGTGGAWLTQTRKICINMKYVIIRLYFSRNGLRLKNLKITFRVDKDAITDPQEYMQLF